MGERVRHFTDLIVWRKAHDLFLCVLRDWEGGTGSRGRDVVFEQLQRSVASISANIAEGFNRSRKRYVNALDIALGEANEAENWLYKARDAGFLSPDVSAERLRAVREIEKMTASLKRKIAASSGSVQEAEEEYVTEHEERYE